MTSQTSRRVDLLGGFRVRAECGPAMVPGSAGRLLAYLALFGSGHRQRLADALWPDAAPGKAGSDLRTALWRVRRVDRGLVTAAGDELQIGEGVAVDVSGVEHWVREAISPPLGLMGQVVELPPHAGKLLLPGWDEPWLEQPRERLRLLQLQAFESLAARLLAAGRTGEALPYAIDVLQAAPLRESATMLMVEIHLRQGNVSEAVSQFSRYRARLRSELGVEPGLTLTTMVSRYLPAESRRSPTAP